MAIYKAQEKVEECSVLLQNNYYNDYNTEA